MSETTRRAPGRPSGGRAIERADIVNAALDALALGGYQGMTMRGVARDVGASLATVQRHFSTKDELWQGAIEHFLDQFGQPSLEPEDDELVRSIDALLGSGAARRGLFPMLFSDRSAGHEQRQQFLAERLVARHEHTLQLIGGMQASGDVRDVDINALLFLVEIGVGTLASASTAAREIYGFDLDDPADHTRLVGALADILRWGLRVR